MGVGLVPARRALSLAALSRETSAIVAQARSEPRPTSGRMAQPRDAFYGDARGVPKLQATQPAATTPGPETESGGLTEVAWLRSQVEQQRRENGSHSSQSRASTASLALRRGQGYLESGCAASLETVNLHMGSRTFAPL